MVSCFSLSLLPRISSRPRPQISKVFVLFYSSLVAGSHWHNVRTLCSCSNKCLHPFFFYHLFQLWTLCPYMSWLISFTTAFQRIGCVIKVLFAVRLDIYLLTQVAQISYSQLMYSISPCTLLNSSYLLYVRNTSQIMYSIHPLYISLPFILQGSLTSWLSLNSLSVMDISLPCCSPALVYLFLPLGMNS